jgi:hypothetical protein
MDYDGLGIQSNMWIQENYPAELGRIGNLEEEEE